MRIVRKIATSVGAVENRMAMRGQIVRSRITTSFTVRHCVAGKNFQQSGFPGSIVSHQSMNSRGQEFQAQIVQRAHPGRSQIRSPNRDRGKTVRVVFSVNRESSFRLSELP